MGQGDTIELTRFEDWPIRLSRFLHERRKTPHAFGTHDCMLFPADVINELTGYDFGKQWRGKYSDEKTAQEIVMRDFKGSLATPFYRCLGEPLPYPKICRRGDAVIFDLGGKPSAGVIDDTGGRVAGVSMDFGLIRVPIDDSMLIWGYG